MMETGSGETARTASLLKEKLLQRAPEHGKYPMDIEGLGEETVELLYENGLVHDVADLYDLAGITCRNYTANRYGWTDIQSAKVIRTREGYTLQLPRTVQIN